MKRGALLLISVFIIFAVMAKEKYSGPITGLSDKYTVEYEYIQKPEGGRIWDGKFSLKGTPAEETYQVTGTFKDGMRDGLWKFSWIENSPRKSYITLDLMYNNGNYGPDFTLNYYDAVPKNNTKSKKITISKEPYLTVSGKINGTDEWTIGAYTDTLTIKYTSMLKGKKKMIVENFVFTDNGFWKDGNYRHLVGKSNYIITIKNGIVIRGVKEDITTGDTSEQLQEVKDEFIAYLSQFGILLYKAQNLDEHFMRGLKNKDYTFFNIVKVFNRRYDFDYDLDFNGDKMKAASPGIMIEVDREQPEPKKNIKKEPDPNKVYDHVEQMPVYPGGQGALLAELARNAIYPEAAKKRQAKGRVMVRFIVTETGAIKSPTIIKSVDPDLDKAAIAAVKGLKKFTPGKENGNTVKVYYTVPITFTLQE